MPPLLPQRQQVPFFPFVFQGESNRLLETDQGLGLAPSLPIGTRDVSNSIIAKSLTFLRDP